MKSNAVRRALLRALVFAFWILAWDLASSLVDSELLLPTPHETALELFSLFGRLDFYKVIFFTLLRVLLGLVIGVASGITLAFICHKIEIAKSFISPIISVIRATPVASFIVLLWVLVSGSALAVIVAFLMVMPIVWQNTLDGFDSIPRELVEVAEIYEFTFKKKFTVLILPVLSECVFPAVITSVGLAWKSEIAAEIIAYTKDSIGMHINDAKSMFLTPTVFAWTVLVIVMSLFLEWMIKRLLGGLKNESKA